MPSRVSLYNNTHARLSIVAIIIIFREGVLHYGTVTVATRYNLQPFTGVMTFIMIIQSGFTDYQLLH